MTDEPDLVCHQEKQKTPHYCSDIFAGIQDVFLFSQAVSSHSHLGAVATMQ